MDEFTSTIRAEGGVWHEAEMLGGQAVVKVRASAGTLTAIAGTVGFRRIPLQLLDDSLSSLTAGQRTAIRDELLAAGYTLEEIQAAFPNLASATLREVLRFMVSRTRKPNYDPVTDTVRWDGPIRPGGDIEDINRRVA